MTDLSEKVIAGDHRSIARLITQVENDAPDAVETMKKIHPYTGQASVIGVTGVMGSGEKLLDSRACLSISSQG